ncbi:DUF1499 domain-containing protein [Rhizobiaceae bacterium n13]|uniref:DUF1499 domain-containing protein n=1 Tax=Ferirhizobium litorale TaxID=2927786 RepID=A0AAE3TZZ5_9HYPH|nr:DUF1499 domain-containing protein [Fererhizobium litorale]MDI7861387.1 DUF1499 domain-containing protein [Fererhizobium litorale]MDI7921534.1 DUF1499 domain-containing protein [Fererhizobium litorale]
MTIRFERPVSHAARFAHFLGRFALLLLLVVAVVHRLGLMPTPYFVALALLSAAIAALALLLALTGLWRLWRVGAVGGRSAIRGLFYSLVPIAVIGFAGYAYFTQPAIYDVSTDTADAPPWLDAPQAAQIWLPRQPEVTATDRARQVEAYPGLTGRRYEGAIDRVYVAAKKVAELNGMEIVEASGLANAETDIEDQPVKPEPDGDVAAEAAAADAPDMVPIPIPRPLEARETVLIGRSSDVLLQGVVETLVLGLHFDVMIRLREEAETTFVDVRVASRYGQNDLGLSAQIAESYLRNLDAELLGIAGT